VDDMPPALTMQDIANLAQVRRSVVSNWRRRPTVRGQHVPFPATIGTINGIEQFSREDVVDYLDRSGRGNNREQSLDAPALSPPASTPIEDLVTLLCLQVCTGRELAGTTGAERDDMARECDPGDVCLRREIHAIKATPDALLFIDDLVEASFGGAEALGRLEHGRPGRAVGARDLTTEAVGLVRIAAKASGLYIDPDGVPLVCGRGSANLLLALAGDFPYLSVPGDGVAQRAVRRRTMICGFETSPDWAGRCVRILSVIGDEANAALDAIDDVVVDLEHGDIAVVLGPASILCDELSGDQEQNRAQTLRPGSLMLAWRLPRGMWREAHRQALGLWICVGGASTARPYVADLAAFAQDELNAGDLAADVAGALARDEARAFRYVRTRDLQSILAARAIVPRGVRAVQFSTTDVTRYLDRIHQATLVTAEPMASFDMLAAAAPGSVVLRRRSMGEMKDSQHLRVLRGSRIDVRHANPAGTVAVLTGSGDMPEIRLDPFDAPQLYPRAARTEPGDVVFDERPRPTAKVDERGGSLVASPSRILRLSPAAGIGPYALAAIINRLPDGVSEWSTWSVPLLTEAAASQLEGALIAAIGYRASVRRCSDAAEDLIGAMIDGVAAGAVTLNPSTEI
jgi:hypothetical protein